MSGAYEINARRRDEPGFSCTVGTLMDETVQALDGVRESFGDLRATAGALTIIMFR